MSIDIVVRTTRSGVPILDRVPLQLDDMSTQEAAMSGGAAPYYRYIAFASAALDIQQNDLLIDLTMLENRTSPPNTRNRQYRVVNEPERFIDGHAEIIVDRLIGNTP